MPEQLPIWRAPGVEPPEELKSNGWQPGMKPSAQHMNWLFNQLSILATNANDTDLTSLTNTVTKYLDDNTYMPYRGSLKDIDYSAKILAVGAATDKPGNSSYYVDALVVGDNPNNRILIARSYNSDASFSIKMVNGVWDSAWTRIDNGNMLQDFEQIRIDVNTIKTEINGARTRLINLANSVVNEL